MRTTQCTSTSTGSSPARRTTTGSKRWATRHRWRGPARCRDQVRTTCASPSSSCASYNAGCFNAYARIADRRDLAFLLHLGDYIYETPNMPPPSQTPRPPDIGRPFDPLHECVTLDDYRTPVRAVPPRSRRPGAPPHAPGRSRRSTTTSSPTGRGATARRSTRRSTGRWPTARRRASGRGGSGCPYRHAGSRSTRRACSGDPRRRPGGAPPDRHAHATRRTDARRR